MAQSPRLARRATASVFWSFLRFGSDQVFNFVVFVVMARLLSTADFGLFVVAFVYAEVGKIIASGGLVSCLYRAPEVTPRLADTIFWSNLGLASVFALGGLVLQQPIADALGRPEGGTVVAALGFVVPVTALGASHMSRNLREFGHKSLALRSMLSGLIGGGLAVVAAWNGFGVWSLVVQRYAAEIINTLVAWRAFRWRPGFCFSLATLREQAPLGGNVALSQLVILFISRTQDLIISHALGAGAVGVYRTAWKSTELLAQGTITPFSTVALPTLAKLQSDENAFRRAYLRIVAISGAISFPCIVGFGLLANELIPLIYGEKWAPSIPVAQALTFLVVPYALNFFADPALTALGRSGVIVRLAVVQLVGTIVFCSLAAPFGLRAIAIAYVVRSYLTLALQLLMFQRATGVAATKVLRSILPQVSAAVAMAVAVMAFSTLREAFPNGWLYVACAVVLGAAVYVPVLALMAGPARAEALAEARRFISEGRRPTSEKA
ncbi:MAG TPA: lipopolysaccharide biosynthesis protein [Phenylobacterium sp.]|uniref:lipopolysaccharide biosynthesis protein n=1 Tax=Phenylobacterium sp. TaxID=1871053 RepID=UPI002F947C9D